MNCLIVNHYASEPNLPGGTRHYQLAKKLARHGMTTDIWCANINYLSRQRVSQQDTSPETSVRFTRFNTLSYQENGIARLANMLHFARLIKKRAKHLSSEPPDVIIGSSPHLFAALGAFKIAKKYSIPFILELRDIWPQSLVDLGNISPRNPMILWMRAIEKKLYQQADGIISLLPNADSHVQAICRHTPPYLWLPNTVDFASIPSGIHSISPPSQGFKLMYAGAHGVANGLDVILESANILANQHPHLDITFELIGDGTEKNRLVQKATELNLKNVFFRAAVPKSHIYETLATANAFIFHLNTAQVFDHGVSPNKLFDYMASMRPIIMACNQTDTPVSASNSGLSIPPNSPHEMANAIVSLVKMSTAQREQLGKNGYQYAYQHHNLDAKAKEFYFFLKSVTKKSAVNT